MNPQTLSVAWHFAMKGAILLVAAVLAWQHVLTPELAATLAAALLSLGMSNGATILSKAASVGAAMGAAAIVAASIPPPPGPSPPPAIPKPPTVPIVPLAVMAILVGVLLAACGASLQEQQVSLYTAEQAACVARAADERSGAACLQALQDAHCGPGGVWYDAGFCSHVKFTTAEGGVAP